MLLEELKKIMPEGTSEDDLKVKLKVINDDAQKLIDSEVKGLKENKEKLLTQMSALKKNQIPDGYDHDGYKEYLEKKDKLETEKKALEDKALEDKGQWDALKIKLNEANNKALEDKENELNGKISILQKALDKELIENAAIKAIETEKGNSLFLLPHMKGKMKTAQDENGNFSVQILDENGSQRFNEDATTPFTVKDLVAEMKANESFQPAFPELNAGGGGNANAGGKGGSGVNPWKKETKNVTEQAKMNRDNPTLAAQMKKAAGVL